MGRVSKGRNCFRETAIDLSSKGIYNFNFYSSGVSLPTRVRHVNARSKNRICFSALKSCDKFSDTSANVSLLAPTLRSVTVTEKSGESGLIAG